MKPILLAAIAALSIATTADARSYGSHHAIYSRHVGRESDLTTHGHYRNVSGHWVHRPAKTFSGHAPSHYTAICGDGSYSFSEHHRGTCSHHGGVSSWH